MKKINAKIEKRILSGHRVCDNCGKSKDVSDGKTCENGHFLCHSCGSRHYHCTVCRKTLR